MYLLRVITSLMVFSQLAVAQENKPLIISAKTVKAFSHSYYNAQAKITGTKIVTAPGGFKTSVATILIYGTIEGNLCLANKVSLNVKSLDRDYNGPVWKENIELTFNTYQQHYGQQPMTIGTTFVRACRAIGIVQPFAMRVAFEANIPTDDSVRGKSGVFNVVLRNAHPNMASYKFRVTFNAKSKKWNITDL